MTFLILIVDGFILDFSPLLQILVDLRSVLSSSFSLLLWYLLLLFVYYMESTAGGASRKSYWDFYLCELEWVYNMNVFVSHPEDWLRYFTIIMLVAILLCTILGLGDFNLLYFYMSLTSILSQPRSEFSKEIIFSCCYF